jgi:anti-sigma28 factor (negative regulator of flagellin synthesis)
MAMKINPGAYNVGKPKSLRINGGELHNKAMSAGKSEENTDKIIISAEGAQRAETDLLVRAAASHIERPADPERLESLRQAVAAGNYRVSTEDLVDALMKRWIGA